MADVRGKQRVFKHFYGSIIFAAAAMALAAFTGLGETGSAAGALQALFVVSVLGVMETSLSLDNAIVNAATLKGMDAKWQRRFLTWGILIAVFGMRVIFPLAIVSVSALVSPLEAVRIALFDHARYESIVVGAHVGISGFGGAFLMLVGLHFFLDPDREHHWFSFVEAPLGAIGRIRFAPYILTIVGVVAITLLLPSFDRRTFIVAAVAGMATYLAVQKLGDALGEEDNLTGKVARTGLGAFIYLEFLDASFSFDGVIGAFAITNDIVMIALGLGIGAMFVRSMTVALVRGGQMADYRFLEPGAFYAIVALAAIMLLSPLFDVPEVVTGLIGAVFIGAAFIASVRHRARFPEQYAEDGEAQAILPSGAVVAGAKTS